MNLFCKLDGLGYKVNYYESVLALSCAQVSPKCHLMHIKVTKKGTSLVIILKRVTPAQYEK